MSGLVFPLPHGPVAPAPDVIHGWRVTSYFGSRRHPVTGKASNHGGMDLAHPGCAGCPLIAVADGLVGQAWDYSGGGWWTSLATEHGTFGYGHALHFADPDEDGPASNYSGRRVVAGTVIAYLGSSGKYTTGAHLHFAYRPSWWGRYADPYDLLVAAHPVAVPGHDLPQLRPRDWSDMATKDEIKQALREVLAERGGVCIAWSPDGSHAYECAGFLARHIGPIALEEAHDLQVPDIGARGADWWARMTIVPSGALAGGPRDEETAPGLPPL